MSAVRFVVALWGGLYLALGPLQTPGDGDLWWQRWLGDLILRTHHLPSSLGPETFTSAGVAWVPQEWAFSVLVALAMDHGVFWALALAVSAVPTVVLVSVYLRSRNEAPPEAIAIVLLFCGLALGESFGVRPQVVGWACFALFLWALGRRDGWLYSVFPIVLVWANFHASVMIAPAIVLARIVGSALDGGLPALRASRDLRVLVLALLAVFCTPLAWHLPAYAITFVANPLLHFIQDEQPVRIADVSFVFGSLPIALLLLLRPRDLLRRKSDTLPLLLVFLAMISTARNIPLFAIIAAPFAAHNLGISAPKLRGASARFRGMEPAALTALCLAILLSAFLLLQDQRLQPPRLPVAAVSSLATPPARHRVFCEDFAWCSIALQFPDLSVYIDGRGDPYPLGVWKSYVSVVTLAPSWSDALRRYRVDAVVALRGSALAKKLAEDPAWRTKFEDQRYVVFLLRKPAERSIPL